MNIIEVACFVGLPSIVAYVVLLGTPDSIRLSLAIGAGSAFVSLLVVVLFGFVHRLLRGRLPERAPVPIWAGLAILISASIALYLRTHHWPRKSSPNQAAPVIVLFDVTFTFTKEDADNSKPSKSHFYVKGDMLNRDRPKDWTHPVDYRNGTVHIRAEVIEKPAGGEPTTWTLCYIPIKGQKNGYGCTGTKLYKEQGVHESDVSMKDFWQNDSIVWSEGIKQMDLVIKDGSGGSGHAHKRSDHEKFFPAKMRITMVQVSAEAKYDPSLVPDLSAAVITNARTREPRHP